MFPLPVPPSGDIKIRSKGRQDPGYPTGQRVSSRMLSVTKEANLISSRTSIVSLSSLLAISWSFGCYLRALVLSPNPRGSHTCVVKSENKEMEAHARTY